MKSTPARVAHTFSCSTAAARNVSAAQISGVRPESLIRRASFPTVVVFPVPFTPTISTTCGACPFGTGVLAVCRIDEDLVLDELAQRIAPRLAGPNRAHDLIGCRYADVGGDERLFERIERLEIDRPAARDWFVGPAYQVVEALDELLLGSRQRLLDLVEKTHGLQNLRFGFRPLTPQHQGLDSFSRRDAGIQHGGHLRDNGQLEAVARAKRQRRVCGAHAFRDHSRLRQNVGQCPPPSELDSDPAIAAQVSRAREREIAEAAQSRQRVTSATLGTREPAKSRQGLS